MYKMDLRLNNLQWLICHKTKPNQTKPKQYLQVKIVLVFKDILPLEVCKIIDINYLFDRAFSYEALIGDHLHSRNCIRDL